MTLWDALNSVTMKLLEKKGSIEIRDATVASEMKCTTCDECKSRARPYRRGSRSSKTLGEVAQTNTKGPLQVYVPGMNYVQVFVYEASGDRRVIDVKAWDADTHATAH